MKRGWNMARVLIAAGAAFSALTSAASLPAVLDNVYARSLPCVEGRAVSGGAARLFEAKSDAVEGVGYKLQPAAAASGADDQLARMVVMERGLARVRVCDRATFADEKAFETRSLICDRIERQAISGAYMITVAGFPPLELRVFAHATAATGAQVAWHAVETREASDGGCAVLVKFEAPVRCAHVTFLYSERGVARPEPVGTLVKISDGSLAKESDLPEPPVFLRKLEDAVPAYKARLRCVESQGMFMDTVSINFHDYGMVAVARWEEGFDEFNAAIELGAKYVRTTKPEEAKRHLAEITARRTRPVVASEFRIRDPFVLVDPETKTYFLYETTSPYLGAPYARGVSVRTSSDLVTWSPPQEVQRVPIGFRAKTQWAPEVYRYGNGYLMFASLARHPDYERRIRLFGEDQGKKIPEWWQTNDRGVWIYRSNRPQGPFEPVSDRQVTPTDWLAIDGTLWVQDGKPYMVFCHEGVQTGNGEMSLAELTPDFKGFASDIKVLFRATDVPGGRRVTDGPWIFRSEKSGRLFMTWSNFVDKHGYSVILAESPSGDVRGPWTNQHVIYGKNGGHGMLFKTIDGKLKFALHYPERRGFEHLRFLDVDDRGDDIVLSGGEP